jgi:ribosomal protein S18 acetylase RimI-like enzyme
LLPEAEVERLERAIVASVAPNEIREAAGWLVPLDDGDIGRAKSAVPLSHAADPAAIAEVEALFEAAALPPAFRIAEAAGLGRAEAELRRRGYAPHTPTIMKLGTAAGLAGLTDETAELFEAPDAAWIATFTGDGFDPAEGRARVRNLARSPGALFAAVREGGRALAVGVVTFGDGWAGVHGMRTAPDARGKGYASRILATFGRAAAARGVERAVLQVKEDNPARRLYRKAGFEQAWRYSYWARG